VRLEVVHTTRFRYSGKIAETVMELRVRPLDGLGQHCRDFDLRITPRSAVGSYRDGFGNHVHYFNHLAPHDQIAVVSRSLVETGSFPNLPLPGSGSGGTPSAYGQDGFPEDFLDSRPPVVQVAGVRRLADRFRPADLEDGAAVEAALDALTEHIHARFEYRPDITTVYTAVDEVLKLRSGVCQDFAHLFLAVARAMGVAARYVSGYITRVDGHVGHGASHAWAEAWIPGRGWIGYDPTNPVKAGDHHVRVAVGRDYRDVAPTRGVYLGAATEALEVAVDTRVLNGG
jgi:transglutaminase-like putative cysteine protease